MRRCSIFAILVLGVLLSGLAPPAAADVSWEKWVARNASSLDREVGRCKVLKVLLDWQVKTEGEKKRVVMKTRNASSKEIKSCIHNAHVSFVKRLIKPDESDKKLYRIAKKLKKRRFAKQ